MRVQQDPPLHPAWRVRLHEVIFEADTAAGRAFDVLLLWCIVLSVLAVLLESVATVHERFAWFLRAAEWASKMTSRRRTRHAGCTGRR